ncbi:MAG: hypothetical protein HC767_13715 [Akkermansiaceae bacterium]|nr:hypothetical protein [Akkermansiaceae bacterium]
MIEHPPHQRPHTHLTKEVEGCLHGAAHNYVSANSSGYNAVLRQQAQLLGQQASGVQTGTLNQATQNMYTQAQNTASKADAI